jgi:hypothetical protein
MPPPQIPKSGNAHATYDCALFRLFDAGAMAPAD